MKKLVISIMAFAFLVGVSGFAMAATTETATPQQAVKTESKAVTAHGKRLKKGVKRDHKGTAGKAQSANDLAKGA